MQSKNAEKTEKRQYSPQFKEQALEHAKRDRVVKAARDLGITTTSYSAPVPCVGTLILAVFAA